MSDYRDELSLLWCVVLNAAVFGAAFRFARRRITADLVQAILDAALIGFAAQYVSVGLPGVLGALRPSTITATAVLLSALLWVGAGSPRKDRSTPENGESSPGAPWIVLVAGLFALGFILTFIRSQLILPVMSNDALTYHFPAAVQWLQTGRLGLFPTWFFNPANTYSPLAGSTFIAWLLAPLDNDALARFVELPALLVIGVAVFQLCRQLGVELATAGIVASAAVLARPMFFPAIMGKDDLFVAFFFLCAVLALTPARAAERFSSVRLGLALGLLLATKYTAMLALPVLLLAVDGPWRAGRRWRWLAAVAGIVIVTAGPWYWRNWWLTGNPVFPIDVRIAGTRVFRGLFTPGRSEGLRSIGGIATVLTGGNYGLPPVVMGVVGAGWLAWCAALVAAPRRVRRYSGDPDAAPPIKSGPSRARCEAGVVDGQGAPPLLCDPLARVAALGPALGILLFVWRSPFPEVRFVLPAYLIAFVACAGAVQACVRQVRVRQALAAALLVLTWWTGFANSDRAIQFGGPSAIVAVVGFAVLWFTRRWPARRRWGVLGGVSSVVVAGYAFVFWGASIHAYSAAMFLPGSGWDLSYPAARPMWQFIAEHVPTDATIAYADTYMVYPLQGFTLDRRVVYVPTRPGVQSLADLPWLGEKLPGERLVPAAIRETVAQPDRQTWLDNLRKARAEYLVVGKGGTIADPPEAAFAESDPKRFRKIYENEGGIVYAIDAPAGE